MSPGCSIAKRMRATLPGFHKSPDVVGKIQIVIRSLWDLKSSTGMATFFTTEEKCGGMYFRAGLLVRY